MSTEKERLVSIRKSDLESLEATIDTLQKREVMEQLRKSDEDIEKGRVRPAKEFLKELD
jgi:PHD/YefM family antitoxin component YafN of YafNO toxin-antitoxin module